jgi:pyridoxal phosphate enzyme (YggS family)
MTTTKERFERAARELADACTQAGRSADEVTLVAVSKPVGPEDVALAIEGGARDFGENRPDQLVAKADQFTDVNWHFIGNIQSRRIRDIVGRATLIHSLFEERHARKIDEIARERGIVQDVLLEVNVSGEESKSGFSVDAAREAARVLQEMEGLSLKGLMCMAPANDLDEARRSFSGLRDLKDELEGSLGCKLPVLSCGMSGDFEVAVEEGSTILRLGRIVFDQGFQE